MSGNESVNPTANKHRAISSHRMRLQLLYSCQSPIQWLNPRIDPRRSVPSVVAKSTFKLKKLDTDQIVSWIQEKGTAGNAAEPISRMNLQKRFTLPYYTTPPRRLPAMLPYTNLHTRSFRRQTHSSAQHRVKGGTNSLSRSSGCSRYLSNPWWWFQANHATSASSR